MIYILILIGKTASGKDKTVNELVSKHGFKKVITYTTRPMRKGEKQDITYHFIPEEEWIDTFCKWIESLPYAKELIMYEGE